MDKGIFTLSIRIKKALSMTVAVLLVLLCVLQTSNSIYAFAKAGDGNINTYEENAPLNSDTVYLTASEGEVFDLHCIGSPYLEEEEVLYLPHDGEGSCGACNDNAAGIKTADLQAQAGTLMYSACSIFDESVSNEKNGEDPKLSAKYDPREKNMLPALRSQGSTGICWAFGALGCCEASLITKGLSDNSIDLSERQLAYYFFRKGDIADPLGNTKGDYNEAIAPGAANPHLAIGGNNLLTIWHLASWCGPAPESAAPFSELTENANIDSEGLNGEQNSAGAAYGNNSGHLQNAYVINIGYSYKDSSVRDTIKKMISKYGAVGTGYRSLRSSVYDNVENDCYYYDAENGLTGITKTQYNSMSVKPSDTWATNHNIMIVGWDDDFAKESFNEEHRPDEDGAWLVRNSWGKDDDNLAQNGYFWLSYQDMSLRQVQFADGSETSNHKYVFVFDCDSVDNYDNIYQYDGSSNYRNYPYYVSDAAAVYETKGSEYESLEAVGIGVKSTDVSYKLSIYSDPGDGSPDSGTLLLSQSGKTDFAGYHTIKLDKPVKLKKGQKVSVVFSQLECESSDEGAALYAASREKISAGGTYYWNFCSDTSSDKTYVKESGSENTSWLDAASRCYGLHTESGKKKTGWFLRSEASEDEISAATRSDYTVRIKAYTEDISKEKYEKKDGESSVSDNSVSDNSVSGNSVSDNSVSDNSVSGNSVSDNSVSDNSVSGNDSDTGNKDTGNGDDNGGSGKDTGDNGGGNSGGGSSDSGNTGENGSGGSDGGNNGSGNNGSGETGDSESGSGKGNVDPGQDPGSKIGEQKTVYTLPQKVKITSAKITGKTLSKASITLKWEKTDCTGYMVYRSTKENGAYKVYKKTQDPSKCSIKLKALSGKKPCYYKVAAYNIASDGQLLVSERTESCGILSCADIIKTVSTDKAVKLTFGAAAGADGYVIYRSKKKNSGYIELGRAKTKKGKKKYSFTDKNAVKTAKYYRIRPFRQIGKKIIYAAYTTVRG